MNHSYDTNSRVLHLGNGTNRSAQSSLNNVVTRVAGNGFSGFSGDGGPAASAALDARAIAIGPDGTVYIADGA